MSFFYNIDLDLNTAKIHKDEDFISKASVLEKYETGHTWFGVNSSPCNKVYKIKDIIYLRFIEDKIYEDTDYIYRILTTVNIVSTISNIGYYYIKYLIYS